VPRRLRRINLRWHDLRHEYASRLVEKNVPLAQVRDLLGHASITTTERYDNQKLENLQAAAARLERGETFDPSPREPVSPSICQVFVKSDADRSQDEHMDRVRETSTNANDEQALEAWLGGRESLLQLSEIPAKTGLPIGCVEERIGLQSECVKRDIRNLMFKLPGQRASADAPRVFTMSSDRYRASAARRGR